MRKSRHREKKSFAHNHIASVQQSWNSTQTIQLTPRPHCAIMLCSIGMSSSLPTRVHWSNRPSSSHQGKDTYIHVHIYLHICINRYEYVSIRPFIDFYPKSLWTQMPYTRKSQWKSILTLEIQGTQHFFLLVGYAFAVPFPGTFFSGLFQR